MNLGEVNGIFEWCGLGALRLGFECFLLKVDGGKGVDGSKCYWIPRLVKWDVGTWNLDCKELVV